ncbi:unnamed protein product [Acanthoscelides obtectus]|uniref:Uncharacterized protein n=1 Tax=Acanthoscelides obtectus TaxID=200917 RepID=A0A9P0PIL2_ACAOB|nr:unnamed protein product [Acanthoscelides obtectus]CAK1672093.1 hypothetical protein AOBTE_LOCUS28641 [Acanthoscelides obtectus]
MCSKWLECYAPPNIKQLEIIFPVVGHSFIPPDRVFGNIEKAIRKQEIISTPQRYIEHIEQYATVINMGVDVPVLDWKKESQNVLKPPGA